MSNSFFSFLNRYWNEFFSKQKEISRKLKAIQMQSSAKGSRWRKEMTMELWKVTADQSVVFERAERSSGYCLSVRDWLISSVRTKRGHQAHWPGKKELTTKWFFIPKKEERVSTVWTIVCKRREREREHKSDLLYLRENNDRHSSSSKKRRNILRTDWPTISSWQ